MTTLPAFNSYGRYASDNYGSHCLQFSDGAGNMFWFSYQTLVAFNVGNGKIVHSNDWGPTTGKHLNWIDGGDKKRRLSDSDFKAAFATQAA